MIDLSKIEIITKFFTVEGREAFVFANLEIPGDKPYTGYVKDGTDPEGKEVITPMAWTKDGKGPTLRTLNGYESPYDLERKWDEPRPKLKISGWVNVYKNTFNCNVFPNIYPTKEKADDHDVTVNKRIACIYVEGTEE